MVEWSKINSLDTTSVVRMKGSALQRTPPGLQNYTYCRKIIHSVNEDAEISEHNNGLDLHDGEERQQAPVEAREFAGDVATILSRCKSSTLEYDLANTITHRSLHNLIGLKRRLLVEPEALPEDEMAELLELLHFSEDEITVLSRGHDFSEIASDDWYEQLRPDGIVLLERWRRWLSAAFHEDNWGDPMTPANRLIWLLEEI